MSARNPKNSQRGHKAIVGIFQNICVIVGQFVDVMFVVVVSDSMCVGER